MSLLGNYPPKDALNRALPIFGRLLFGNLVDQIINSVNGLANQMDRQGGLGTAATVTSTIAGTVNSGDTFTLTVLNPSIVALVSPGVVVTSQTVSSIDTRTTIAASLANLINTNATMSAAGITATAASSVVTIREGGTIGNATTITSALSSGASVTVTMGNGGVLAGGAGTFGGANATNYGIVPLSART